MLKKISVIIIAVFAVFCFSSCVERVDAGCEGIKFNLAGSDKGIDDVALVSGWVFFNPFTTGIYEYPTYAQTIDYAPFTVNSKDGTLFTIDPSMIVKIEEGKSPSIFKKYRKDLDSVILGSLRIYVVDAARNVFNQFSADSIISNRTVVDKAFDEQVRTAFVKEGFQLEQLTPGIKYPKSYENAIDAKNVAIQNKMRVANEVEVAKAEAEKLLVAARAEAEANRLKQQALTPQILEKMWIERWNGVLPQYGQVPTLFKDITK